MSRDDSPYTDDAYRDEYEDEPAYEEAYHDDESGSFFPYPGSTFGWPPGILGGGVDDEYDRTAADERDDAYDEARVRDEYAEDDSLLDEGVIALILVVGLVLFLVPEPVTSAVGILLLLVGVIAWLADAVR